MALEEWNLHELIIHVSNTIPVIIVEYCKVRIVEHIVFPRAGMRAEWTMILHMTRGAHVFEDFAGTCEKE